MLKAKGPSKVFEEIGRGGHGQPGSPMRNMVEDWLRSEQSVTDSEASDKRDAREEKILAIAKEANRFASEANAIARLEAATAARSSRYAMYAAIIAATIMLVDNKDQILALIFIHP